MELKVHIEKSLRVVCGLNEQTTVQDVIIALAHSLKQTGRFYLIEKLNHLTNTNNEKSDISKRKLSSRVKPKNTTNQIFICNSKARVMSPSEHPIELLRNYSNLFDCQSKPYELEFHLIRSTSERPDQVASELIEQINQLNASSSITEYLDEESEIETSHSTTCSNNSNNSNCSSYSTSNGDEMTFTFKTSILNRSL